MPTEATQSAVERCDSMPGATHRQGAETLHDQLDRFVRCLFDPGDIVEIRRLPCGRSTWHRAADLPVLGDELARQNSTENIYAGANPRVCKGDGSKADTCSGGCCGRCRLCVALARCAFVDLDETTLDQACFRLRESGLPAPTVIVVSGGGVHLYWRLAAPIPDLEQWSDVQSSLAARLNGDLSVHDPPRIMRLPGLLNRKYQPPRPCTLVEACPERVYPLEEFEPGDAPTSVTAQPRANTANGGPIREQTRNNTLFRIAAGMRSRGCSKAGILAALLVENRAQCIPPLDEAEVRGITASAGRYPPGSVAVASDWRPFPVYVLPEPVRSFVVEGAEAMGCDPAYIALPVLACTAAAIGTTRRVHKRAWAEAAMASIYKKDGKGPYIIAYFDHTGHRREKSSRTTDHATAERIANKLEAGVALRREGVIDARADRIAREGRGPIRAHLDDFITCLSAKGVTAKQIGQLRTRIERVLTTSGAETVNDITPHGVQTAIGAIRGEGAAVQTCNHTLRAVKQFTRWLLRDGRIAVDPILHLKTGNAETDRRYERRALDEDELSRLVSPWRKPVRRSWRCRELIGRWRTDSRCERDSA